MKEKISHNSENIYYTTSGKRENPAIFFLHGFLESSEVWNDFIVDFLDQYYIVCVDLPGHGESDSVSETQTMGDMAYAVKAVAESLNIKKFHLVGHSMGGYVAMAYRDKFPDMLLSYVLFHSTCFADSTEKRIARDREIELILQGKKSLIVNTNVPKTFADSNLKKLSAEVDKVKQIAMKTTDNGIICALKGMKLRADRSLLLMAGGISLLLIAGRKDSHIPIDVMLKMKKMAKNSSLVILEKSGHMGFIEEKEKTVKELRHFFSTISPDE